MLYLFHFPAPPWGKKIILSEFDGIYLEAITDEQERQNLSEFFARYARLPFGKLNFDRIVKINSSELAISWGATNQEIKTYLLNKQKITNLVNTLLFALPRKIDHRISLAHIIDTFEVHLNQIYQIQLDESIYRDLMSQDPSRTFDARLEGYFNSRWPHYASLERVMVNNNLFLALNNTSNLYNEHGIDLQYIWEYLELYKHTDNPYMRLFLLVSLIEGLLCSGKKDIGKQFSYKMAIIIEHYMASINRMADRIDNQVLSHEFFESLDNLPALIDCIYTIRSQFAHGSKKDIEITVKKFAEKKGIKPEDIHFEGNILGFVEDMTSALISLAITNPSCIALLRDSWSTK